MHRDQKRWGEVVGENQNEVGKSSKGNKREEQSRRERKKRKRKMETVTVKKGARRKRSGRSRCHVGEREPERKWDH